ncbi:MAG: glycerophosphodiester phosphodiesterase family protein [Nitrososphaerales archaeon]
MKKKVKNWESDEILIIGHRGYPVKYPENTIVSFLMALKSGADAVELDVYTSRDGIPIIAHDPVCKDIFGREVTITKSSSKRLIGTPLSMGQCLPTLRDLLNSIPKETLLNIEFKHLKATDKVYKVIKKASIFKEVLFSSFDIEALRRIKEIDKDSRIGLLLEDFSNLEELINTAIKLEAFSFNLPIDEINRIGKESFLDKLRRLKNKGFKVILWTVNDPSYLRILKGYINGIITDEVEIMVSKLRR